MVFGVKLIEWIKSISYYFQLPLLFSLFGLSHPQHFTCYADHHAWKCLNVALFFYIIFFGILGTSYRFALRLVDEIGIFSVIKFTAFTVNFPMTFSISISYGVTYSQFSFNVRLKRFSFFVVVCVHLNWHSTIVIWNFSCYQWVSLWTHWCKSNQNILYIETASAEAAAVTVTEVCLCYASKVLALSHYLA